MRNLFLIFAAILCCLPGITLAQLVPLKTIPVASGDQFMVFPSQNLGMGNPSIALDDPYADPFINPAKGIRLNEFTVFSAPTFYNITDENGSARTLPFGVLVNTGDWFGGFTFSAQELEGRQTSRFIPFARVDGALDFIPSFQPPLEDKAKSNLYMSGLLGTEVSPNLSFATSIFFADLNAVEGVDLLYPRSNSIEQFGTVFDFRAGFLGKIDNRRFYEILLLHNRFNMTHNVNYGLIFEDFPTGGEFVEQIEKNLDRTNTWGAHFGYVQPLGHNDWKIGGILTVNRKDHPKIPNFELVNIPRDPGNSWAFATGVGIAMNDGPATFAADLIFEPIWSHTWAEAAEPVQTFSGQTIPAGGRTIENDFQFRNWLLKMGIGHQAEVFGFQLGMQMRLIRYQLEQDNLVEGFQRFQKESWTEWTPSIGFNMNFPEFHIRYTGRFTTGTGQPGIISGIFAEDAALAAPGNDIIAAPGGSLTVQETLVFSHQFTLSIPIRR